MAERDRNLKKINNTFWFNINKLIEEIIEIDIYQGYFLPQLAEYFGRAGRSNTQFSIFTGVNTTISMDVDELIYLQKNVSGEIIYEGSLAKGQHQNKLFILSQEYGKNDIEPYYLSVQSRDNTLNQIIIKLENGKNYLQRIIEE